MKIAIISVPRSGSSMLFRGLHNSLNNYKGFCEPFNSKDEGFGDDKSQYSLSYDNLIVKLLVWDVVNPNSLFNILSEAFQQKFYNIDNIKTYITNELLKYLKNFNRVILLSRKNKKELVESTTHSSTTQNFHNNYIFNENNFIPSEYFLKNENRVDHCLNMIQVLSTKLNLPINYYEDIYTNSKKDVDNFLEKNNLKLDNPNKLYECLDLKNRYRQI